MVRARCVYGSQRLISQFTDVRLQVLASTRDTANLKEDVLSMRQKMRDHLDKSNEQVIDIKQGQGGLVDIEFMVQYLVLKLANKHPEVCRYSDNLRILQSLAGVNAIEKQEQITLSHRYCQLRDFAHRQSLQNSPSLMEKLLFEENATPISEVIGRYLN